MKQGADAFNLRRFVDAQNTIIDKLFIELRTGRKWDHWMWFVFPRIEGLSFSRMAERCAIYQVLSKLRDY